MAEKIHTDGEALYAVGNAVIRFTESFQNARNDFLQCFEQMNSQVDHHLRMLRNDVEDSLEEKRRLERELEGRDDRAAAAKSAMSRCQENKTDSFICDVCGTRMMLLIPGNTTRCKSESGCSGTMHRYFNNSEYYRYQSELQSLAEQKRQLQEKIEQLEEHIRILEESDRRVSADYSDLQMHEENIMSLMEFGSGEDPETAAAYINRALMLLGDYQAVSFDTGGITQQKRSR